MMTFGHIAGIILEDEQTLLPPPAIGMGATTTTSTTNGIRIDDEVLVVATNSGGNIAIGNSQITCTVEFQVMKKYPGHCVRLGKNGRGCVAGNHIVPFHPDCF